ISGKFCAVKGCHNSYRKLKMFLDQECYEHKPTIRAECKCPRPFKLHKMPSDDEGKRQWLAALNLKCPPRNIHVCSFHFVDRQPSTENPYPELWLGYDRPLRKKRRRRTCPDEAVLRPHENLAYQTEIEQQILLTLMKLKLNLLIEDLAIRFRISVSKVSRIISFWIDTMAAVLKDLIPWLPKETIRATTPEAYKQHYPNVTCILDCSESEVQRPGNLDSRSESYSHYYACNTIKYLVAIAPCGLVMFISAAYGGRCSDKFITCDSGILEYLHPGDEVMVDRGFLIRDLLFERQVNMIIPHFANKTQLTEEKVTCSRRIANVRIHVERAIRRLKVYKVLSQTLPITLMAKIDQILHICAALVNLRGDLICEADN
uniref:THAP-type domain-containing protein n=1 Tax=Sinocyclocheilus grahami TaxID=75366 RepID=A0A672M5F3_SINGR